MPSEDPPTTSSEESPSAAPGESPSTYSGDATPPYSVALLTIPYAVPFALGIVFLVWGGVELDRIVTTYYGTVKNLFETVVVLTAGSILLLYGSAGALSKVVRESTGT